MSKLTSFAALSIVLVAVGCEPLKPADNPHAGPPAAGSGAPPAGPGAPTPPGPPNGGPGAGGDHAGGPGGPGTAGPGGWPHHGERGDHDQRDHGGMTGGPHDGPGRGEHKEGRGRRIGRRGDHGPGEHGGNEVMRELAMLGVQIHPAATILARSKEIGLTPDQVTKIRAEIVSAQSKSIDLKAKVDHARIESARLLSAEKIDEKAVDAQIDEATKAEAEIHKLRVGAMLRVRAILTPEQKQKLDEAKPKKHRGPKTSDASSPGGMGGTDVADADDEEEEDDDDA